MRYEDASGAFQASGPVANDDSDTLSAGQKSATGNLITGEGTQYGASGADSAAGGHITSIAGKGGEDSSFAGGKLSVTGEHGQLSVDAEGNYNYMVNKGAPENVRDRFTYTLADNQGNNDTAALIVEIGKTPVVIKADAQQIVPGPDGVVTLPPGVELSDIMVVGRNLVVNLPDGTQLIILDGAVFVPQLQLGGVEVPAANVAALLIGQEPQPAAGETPPSSGGNFALPPPPLDPGVPLGDLIPPTEYTYQPPEPQEVLDAIDNEPTITIEPDGQPASVNAVDSVDEAGLPERNEGEPEGSGEEAAAGADGDPSEATSGVIHIDSPDGPSVVAINGVAVTSVGQVIQGEYGALTITSISDTEIGYSYLLSDNIDHSDGVPDQDDFSVTVTDVDGDQATATLTINIVDDEPTARDDTDAVIKGDTSTDGNVMTGVGTTSAPGGVDTVGADDAEVTGAHAGTSGSFTNVPDGGVLIVGQFGDLTLFPDGSYTYTLHAEVGDGGNDVFTYQLTDGDGDTSDATLTIAVPPDLKPVVGPNPTVLLDDDALPGGNPGGTGDDPDAVNVSGQLSGSGGDGPLTFSVQLTGAPAGFTYVSGGAGIVLIQQGGLTVLTVTVNPDGSYSVEQNNPIDHAAGGDENNQPFTINYTVTDSDGDSANGTLNINVDDDSPVLDEVVSQGDVTLDETDAGSPAGFPISDTSALPVIDFTALFGADGAAAVDSVVLGLVITGGPNSGLQSAVGDFPITLVQIDGDTIEGHYNGSNVAFIIQLNGDGTVTLTQNVPLEHLVDGPPGPDHNDSLDLAGLIAVTVTITDGDGDQASAQAGIGDSLVFLDDGPDAQVDEEATLDTLVLDETRPVGTEEDGDSDPAGLMTVQANFADNFVSPVDFGADGAGTVSYALALNGSDVPSGLYAIQPSDTDAGDGDGYGQGEQIVLNQSGNTITGSAGGVDYFTITIDPVTGVATFTQLDNIWHANTGSDDDTSTLMAEAGALLVQQIVTDSDGDFDTASVDVSQGVFQIEDDGPDAANDTDTVGDPGSTATGNVITDAEGDGGEDDVGEDQPGTITDLASVNEPANSDSDPDPDVFEIQGEFGVLVMNADGSYTYTRDPGTPGGAVDVFTYTLADADGDSTTATLTITLGDAEPVLPDPDLVQLDDDDVGSDGNPGGTGDDDPSGLPGQLNGSGGDGDLDYNFTGVDTLPAGFSTNLVNAGTLQILQGLTVVLTITLDNETGAFNVVQNNPIDHLALEGTGEDDTENNYEFLIGVEVEDSDGDVEPATITINVDDDTPVADDEASVTGLVDEDDLPAGNNDNAAGDDDPGNADGDNDGTTTGGNAGSLLALFSFGADQPGTVSLSTDTSGLPVLHSNGVLVTYAVVGDTLTASAGGSTVFTLQVNADGSWTFDLEGQLDHPTADTEDNIDIDFSSIIIGEDNDGDEVTAADGTFVVTVDDDLPVPAGDVNPVTGQVDEDALADGNNDSAPGDDPGGTTASGAAGSLLSLFNIGADQPGTVSLSNDTSGLPALTSNGVAVTYAVVGNVLTASAGATDVFTLTVNADGSWEFELLDQLDHQADDFEDNLLLDFSSIIVAEDADGDTATLPDDSFVIDVDDDMPVAFDPDPITSGVENMAGETATADLDVDGNIDDNVGADQPGVVRFANIANGDDSGFESGEVPIEYWLSNDGQTLQGRVGSTDGTDGTLIFQIDLNQDQGPGDDTYTITMFGTIDNGAGVTFDDLTSTAAGNVSFRGVGADDAGTTVDLLLSAGPGAGVTVNTDSDSIGAANQSMDVGETVRIDFVTNLTEDTADPDTPPSGFNYGAHVSTNSFIGLIPQVQGSQTETVAFTVYALDSSNTDTSEPDRDPTGGFTDATITTITEVTIDGFDVGETEMTFDITGFAEGVFTALAYGISVRPNSDGSVTFSGIQQGDSYGFSTVGEGDFNAVVVQSEAAGTGGSSEDSFDLGVFSIGIVDTGDPIDLSYDLELTDADGDSVLVTDALQITIAPDTSESLAVPFAAESSAETSSFSLLASDSQEQQLQKSAANSNTLTLATAVAAAGLSAKAAAHDNGHDGHGQNSDLVNAYASETVETFSAADDSGDAAVSMLAPEPSAEQSAPAETSGSSSADSSSQNSLDDSPAPAADDSGSSASSGDDAPASAAADASPVAPAVAMVSAEALQAAAGVDGDAQQGSSVEQVVADALGQGDAPTVDAVLANLPGGIGELAAIAHMASPASEAVSGWDMAANGAFGSAADMMMSMHAPNMHHDAVQPVVNG